MKKHKCNECIKCGTIHPKCEKFNAIKEFNDNERTAMQSYNNDRYGYSPVDRGRR
jgi:hypothetical protein